MRRLAILAVLAATPAAAATISGAYVGCTTKDLLDEVVTAAVNQDYRQMEALLDAGCYLLDGMEYSVVDRGFIKTQIRVYGNGASALLWTVAEAAR